MNIRKFIEENILTTTGYLYSKKCNKEWFIKNNYVNEYNAIDNYQVWFSKYPDLKISFKINCILQDFKDEPLCPECKSPLIKNKKINNPVQLIKRCSKKCAQLSEEIKDKIKNTNLEKYGVENVYQSNIIKDKIKNTMIERYGVENPYQSKEVKEKIKSTNLKKYGVENPSQLKEIKAKFKNTCLERYGVENPMQSKKIRERVKNTCLERYGVENPMQSKKIRERVKNTNLERYGTEYGLQSKKVKEKSKATNLKKYGVEHLSQSKGYKEKILKKNSKKEPLFYNKELAMEVYKEGGFELYKNSLNNEYTTSHIKKVLFNLGVVDRKEFGSSFEEDVYFFLKTVYNGTIIKNSYNYIKPFQLDFYLEDVNIGIECNGDYYHSKEKGTPKDYHQNKSLLAIKNGISLIHIYEHEWYSEKQDEIKDNIVKLIKGEKFNYTLDCFNINHIPSNFKYTKPLKMEHKSLTIYNSGKFIK